MAMPIDDAGYAMKGQRGLSNANSISQTLREPTALDNASETFDAAYQLCERVHSLVDRIVGHASEAQGTMNEKVSPVPNGIVEELRDKAFRTERSIRSAQAALDRLQAQI